jgi:hypothetical protein
MQDICRWVAYQIGHPKVEGVADPAWRRVDGHPRRYLHHFGSEHRHPEPHAGPYLFFDLTFIDWDHSLLMAAFWSVVWGRCSGETEQRLWWQASLHFSLRSRLADAQF